MTIIMPGNIGEVTPYKGNKFFITSDGYNTTSLSEAIKHEKKNTNIENIKIIIL